ncbi:MAG: hypothetical protein ABIL52_03025 [candidate division WOR-3 bacterium]
MQENKLIEEVIDFDHFQVFDKVSAYTSIIIISKRKKNYFIFKKVKNPSQIQKLDSLDSERIYFDELNHNIWVLSNRDIIQAIENQAYRLKDIADIKVGLATLKDEIYIIENVVEEGDYFVKFFNGRKFLIEKEITKEIIKVSNFPI